MVILTLCRIQKKSSTKTNPTSFWGCAYFFIVHHISKRFPFRWKKFEHMYTWKFKRTIDRELICCGWLSGCHCSLDMYAKPNFLLTPSSVNLTFHSWHRAGDDQEPVGTSTKNRMYGAAVPGFVGSGRLRLMISANFFPAFLHRNWSSPPCLCDQQDVDGPTDRGDGQRTEGAKSASHHCPSLLAHGTVF